MVWEFAARELAFGDWKILELKLGQLPPAWFSCRKQTKKLSRPGTVPYKDHILALHLTDLAAKGSRQEERLESLVYLWSMRDNMLTPAARLRSGDRVTLRLQSWSDVAEQYEKINRSEAEDTAVQLEEPCWGEIVE